VCSEIREYFGVGDPNLAGSYCIKEGTQYTGAAVCGQVHGVVDFATCEGNPAP